MISMEARHIDRLPNELLVEVFRSYDATTDDIRRHLQDKARRYQYLSDKRPRDCCRWMRLMLVRRHWRVLGVSTPSLWQLIEVGDNQDWVELALARSGSSPIRLLFTHIFPQSQTPSFLIPHGRRIQKLIIDHLQGSLSRFQVLFDSPMPLLEEVDIANPWAVPSFSNEPELVITPLPMLRTLRLSSFPILFDHHDLSQLQCLSLVGRVFFSELITLEALMAVLRRCAELKELRLCYVLRLLMLPVVTPPAVAESMTLSLPKLRKLVVQDRHTWTISGFLSKLQLSPEVTLRLCADWSGGLSDAFYTEGLDSLLPTDRSGIPILRSITSASIDCWHDSKVALIGRTRTAKVTLKIAGSRRDPGILYLPYTQEQFCCVFDGAPLRSLDIAGDWDSVVPDIRYYHLRFFDAYPALRSLKAWGCGSPVTLLRSLSRPLGATVSDPVGSSDSRSAPSQSQVCPKLRFLTLEYAHWRQEVIDALLEVLRSRIEEGLPKLEELALLAKRESRMQEMRETQLWRVLEAHVGELQSLVTKLKYGMIE